MSSKLAWSSTTTCRSPRKSKHQRRALAARALTTRSPCQLHPPHRARRSFWAEGRRHQLCRLGGRGRSARAGAVLQHPDRRDAVERASPVRLVTSDGRTDDWCRAGRRLDLSPSSPRPLLSMPAPPSHQKSARRHRRVYSATFWGWAVLAGVGERPSSVAWCRMPVPKARRGENCKASNA